ncbi:MAG: hypothetical protein MJD61_00235, partial [Proteobacteria bacterium]|nr:hypothetical protein [Pseudomonadota bacterium]
ESGAHPSLLRRVFGKSMSKHEKARQARLESSAGQRLEVSFGAVAFWRFLSYADAFRAVPRAYANPPLSPGLGAALAVRYFLFAGLGVHAGGRSSLGLTTKDAIDGHFATRAYQLLSGLMLRLPVSGLYLLLRADYGYQAFSLRGAAYTPELPSVAYQFVRGGIDSRLRLLDDLTLDVEAAYLYLIDVGDLGSSDYFPNVAGAAVEGLLGLRRPLLEHMSVRLGLSYRRYFFAFHPRPDHQRIVGGALDQFLTVTVSAIYHH